MEHSIRRLAAVLLVAFGIVSLALAYWQVVRSNDLVYSAYNGRLADEEGQVQRGQIVDRTGRVLASSDQTANGYVRRYSDPITSPVTGYYSQKYGSTGLESSYNRFLRGDVQASPIDTLAGDLLHRHRVGADLKLTLDSRLQAVAAQQMGSDKGAIVALDPHTGAVLAMVSTPYFDPNRVDQDWKQLQSDPDVPLYNRAAQGLYTPGSIFKIVTASAAIDLGLVDLDKHYVDTKDLTVDGFTIKNKNHPNMSDMTFVKDFAFSCNVTFARTGLGLDTKPLPLGDDNMILPNKRVDESRKRFLEYTNRFGLESELPFDLPTSVSRVGNPEMSRVELANSSFGQGELQVTPLLMALGAASIANGGKMPEPYLVDEVHDNAGNVLMQRAPSVLREVISADSARSMNRLMVDSVQEGYAKPAAISGIEVGGKTGSAEVGPNQKTHSWFIGYAPADNPQVAVAVIIENKGPGSDFATPAGKKVMEAALGR